ncbi:MAG TPA: hypothetical protein VFB58_16990 [Chloroflexota bacterium]|nr:hypothetical protein [Chloroflexota bacterium]
MFPDDGQALVEYALLLSLISIVAMLILHRLSVRVDGVWTAMWAAIDHAQHVINPPPPTATSCGRPRCG